MKIAQRYLARQVIADFERKKDYRSPYGIRVAPAAELLGRLL